VRALRREEADVPRQDAHPRTPFAPGPPAPERGPAAVRPAATRRWARARALLVAPFAGALAAIAGLAFLLLLPVCGIASIAGAVAKASWAAVREALRGVRERTAPRS
jgi:hypothetical protein